MAKSKKSKLKIVVTTALNLANHSERRRKLDRLSLSHLAGLKPKGYDLVIHAIGTDDEDRELAEELGLKLILQSNENLGKKRNEGLQHAVTFGDVVIQIGSDDLLSEGFIDFVATVFSDESVGSLKIRGFYEYDTPTGRLSHFPNHVFATAFRSSILDGDLYETDKGIKNIDLTLHTRLWSMSERSGCRQVTLDLPDSAAYVFLKCGDELHSFDDHVNAFSKLTTVIDGTKADEFIERHFSNVSLKTD